MINQLLVQNGILASQFFLRQAGLEEMFMELTEDKTGGRV
jgi:hypothetical protein